MIHSAIAFAIGCLWIVNQSSLPSYYCCFLLVPSLWIWFKFQVPALFFLCLGALISSWHSAVLLDDRLSSEMVGKDVLIQGYIDTIPNQYHHRARFDFSPDKNIHPDIPSKIRVSWYQSFPKTLAPGQKWQLLLRLKPPVGMSNPITFDYEKWLFQQNIGALAYVRSTPDNVQLMSADNWSFQSFRFQLFSFIEQHLAHTDNLGLLQALVTGVKHNIHSDQWQVLTLSGTSHLLAISGLHIGLAATIGFIFSGFLWSLTPRLLLIVPRQYIASLGGVVTASFYAAMAGFAIPTQRALLMVVIVMISLCLKRPVSSFQLLAICLFLILFWDPLAVLDPGFYLSFVAVAIIFIHLHNYKPAPRFTWLKIHGVIALGLTPLLILFFGQTSLIAPIANLIAVPFVSLLVVPLLLIAAFTHSLADYVSIFLFDIADVLLGILWPALAYLSSVQFASVSISSLPIFYWLLLCLSTLLFLLPRGTPLKSLGVIGFLPLFIYKPDKPDTGEFWFHLLDVGQGLSAVIQTKNHTLLFDTGAHFSDSFNAGEHIIVPFLKQSGVHSLDTVVVSHGDNDHIGGLASVIHQLSVKKIISNEMIEGAQPCIAGQNWQWDQVKFEVLHPSPKDTFVGNNRSCVVKVSAKSGSVLLTGDIEKEAEQTLIARYPQKLDSTLLVAPHHGSKTSSTSDFIERVSPNLVMFAAGYLNRFNHPHPTVLARYELSSQTLNTATNGALLVQFTEHGVEPPISWRKKSQKIWTAQLTK